MYVHVYVCVYVNYVCIGICNVMYVNVYALCFILFLVFQVMPSPPMDTLKVSLNVSS